MGRTTRRLKPIYFRQIKENRAHRRKAISLLAGEDRGLFNLTCSCKSKSRTWQRLSPWTEESDSRGRLRSFNKIAGSTLSKLESAKVPLVGNVSAGSHAWKNLSARGFYAHNTHRSLTPWVLSADLTIVVHTCHTRHVFANMTGRINSPCALQMWKLTGSEARRRVMFHTKVRGR